MGELNIYEVQSAQNTSDYIGFTFNGIHSSELGIKRTSDGSRFNENLLPTSEDKTVQIPGGDGTYYFGSYYTQKQFDIPFAFDSLTEQQLAKIKRVFGDKKIHDLIFDEVPYKVYSAKVIQTATIKYIPFEEGSTNRIYKGEGTLTFVAYEPFARSVHKYANEYNNSNFIEWQFAANLLEEQGNFDRLIDNKINLYNPGDKETNFILTFDISGGKLPAGGINIGADAQLNFKEMIRKEDDVQIQINSKLNLIEGFKKVGEKYVKSGNIYNEYITNGSFFKIPTTIERDEPLQLVIDNANGLSNNYINIEYDYFYF